MKEQILKLRKEGKFYNEIATILNCSKSIVSYHSRMAGLGIEIEKLSDDELKKRNYLRVKSHRQNLKEKAVKYKGGKCQNNDCGYNKCIWAFDFHHLDPTKKDFSLSKNITLSWDKVKKELDKCMMLCSNCHRELHYNEYKNKVL